MRQLFPLVFHRGCMCMCDVLQLMIIKINHDNVVLSIMEGLGNGLIITSAENLLKTFANLTWWRTRRNLIKHSQQIIPLVGFCLLFACLDLPSSMSVYGLY